VSLLKESVTYAATAVVATIGLGVLLVKEIVLPAHVGSITHGATIEKRELNEKLEAERKAVAATQAEITKLQTEVASLKRMGDDRSIEVAKIKARLFAAEQSGVFSMGNPYPIGIDRVKLGDGQASIERSYAEWKMTRRTGAIDLVADSSLHLFSKVSFGWNPEKDNDVIHSVHFSFSSHDRIRRSQPAVPEGWLREALIRVLGRGVTVGTDDNCMTWIMKERAKDDRILVYHADNATDFWVITTKSYPANCPTSTKQAELLKAFYEKK
jgi:hypothetical protein